MSSSSTGFNQSSLVLIFGREVGFCLEELEGAFLKSKSPLEEVEEDLDHHGIAYETEPMLLEFYHCCHVAWILQELCQ
ncbi:hypothetical protein Tco_0359045 [Tanacetum coccineum]